MVLARPVAVKKKARPVHVLHRDKVRKLVALSAAAAATAVVTASGEKVPMHTSWQTGQRWIDELLEGAMNQLITDHTWLEPLYSRTSQSIPTSIRDGSPRLPETLTSTSLQMLASANKICVKRGTVGNLSSYCCYWAWESGTSRKIPAQWRNHLQVCPSISLWT
jgi:hypothetical protein